MDGERPDVHDDGGDLLRVGMAVAVQPDFAALTQADREAVYAYEETLAALYASELERITKEAAAQYAKRAMAGLAITAAGEPDWHLPYPDEILNVDDAAKRLGQTTEGLRGEIAAAATGGTLAAYGIRFDLRNPLLQDVFRQLGTHITSIVESQRAEIMGVLQKAYDSGLSIRETTRELGKMSATSSSIRGAMIARTEIGAAANGGSLAAAKLIINASPPGAKMLKYWVATEDDRTRDSHLAAAADYSEDSAIPMNEPFQVGGDELQHPCDPDGSPEEVINCRCAVAYVQPAESPNLGGFGGLGGEGLAAPAGELVGEESAAAEFGAAEGYAEGAFGPEMTWQKFNQLDAASHKISEVSKQDMETYIRTEGAARINRDLRAGKLPPEAGRIDRDMANRRLGEDIQGYRGVGHDLGDVGDTFTDLGYTSVTTQSERALRFGNRLVRMRLPRGTNIMTTPLKAEKEFVLPRGTTWRVIDKQVVDGTTVYDVELESYPKLTQVEDPSIAGFREMGLTEETRYQTVEIGGPDSGKVISTSVPFDEAALAEPGMEAFQPTVAPGVVAESEPIMRLSDDMLRADWTDVAARDRAQSIVNEASLDLDRVLSYRSRDGKLRGVANVREEAGRLRVEVAGADREAEQELLGRAAATARRGGRELWVEGATDAQRSLVRDLVRNKYQKVVGLKEQGGFLKVNRTGIDNIEAKFAEREPVAPVAPPPPVEPPPVAPPPPSPPPTAPTYGLPTSNVVRTTQVNDRLVSDASRVSWENPGREAWAKRIMEDAARGTQAYTLRDDLTGQLRGVAVVRRSPGLVDIQVAGADAASEANLIAKAARYARDDVRGGLRIAPVDDAQENLVRDLLTNQRGVVVNARQVADAYIVDREGVQAIITRVSQEPRPPVGVKPPPVKPPPRPAEPPTRVGKTSDEYTLFDLNDQIYNRAQWGDADALGRARALIDKADPDLQRIVSYHDADGNLSGIALQTDELLDVRLELAGADETADGQLIAHAAAEAARNDKELWIQPGNEAQAKLIRTLLKNKYGKTVSVTEKNGMLRINRKGVTSILQKLRPGEEPPTGPPPTIKKPAAPPPTEPIQAEAGTAEGGASTSYAKLTKMSTGDMFQIRAGYRLKPGYTGYKASMLTPSGSRISTLIEASSEAEARQKLDQLAQYIDNLPPKAQKAIKRIGSYAERSPHDAESAIRYGKPGFRSAATAWQDSGDIAFWNGGISEQTLYHESGHIVGEWGTLGTSSRWGVLSGKPGMPPRWERSTPGGPRGGYATWANAAVKDAEAQRKLGIDRFYDSVEHGRSVRIAQQAPGGNLAISSYAETFISEDWADSVMAFLYDQRYGTVGKITLRNAQGFMDTRSVRFAELWPNRARIIARALGYPPVTASGLLRRGDVRAGYLVVRRVVLHDLEYLVGEGVADEDLVGSAVWRGAFEAVTAGGLRRHGGEDTRPSQDIPNAAVCKRVVRRG